MQKEHKQENRNLTMYYLKGLAKTLAMKVQLATREMWAK